MSRRDDVAAALRDAPGFLGAQAIYARIRQAGTPIGMATVYRVLQSLAEAGDVDVVRTGDGEALYGLCRSRAHHHHLLCRSCGRAVELDPGTVERWAREAAQEHGFSAVRHVVEVTGLCAECTAR